MATILGTRTINGVDILNVQADPNTGGGTAASIGSIAICANGNGIYQKQTTSSTSWTQLVINGGAAPIPDLGGGNFMFDARLQRTTTAVLFAGVNTINVFNPKAGDVYYFVLETASIADEVYIIDASFIIPTIVPSINTVGGGSYIPTAAIGAKDLVMVVVTESNFNVFPVAKNLIA